MTPTTLGVFEAIWQEGFADLDYDVLEAAFRKTLRECKFWPIKVADVREHIEKVQANAAEEEAERKWHQVREYIRLYYNPDIPPKNAPPITEHTRRAIGAAGGLAYLSDCDLESLQWARKRFVEAYIRYGKLQQDEYLLPASEVRDLLEASAEQKQLPGEGPYGAGRAIGESYRGRLVKYSAEVRQLAASPKKAEPRLVIATSERLEFLERQKRELLAKATPEQIHKAERFRTL